MNLMSSFQEHKLYHKHRILWNLLLICSILLVLMIIYIQFFSSEMNIKPFGIEVLRVMSDSMNPVFKKNDIIIIQEQNEYKVGDIVAYIADDGNIVTHRIIEENENGFYTKGDNNNAKDEALIYPNNIIGKFKVILYSSRTSENTSQ